MALIKCKECGKEFQDPSFNCDYCLKEIAGAYNKICPICRQLHNVNILDNKGYWHCMSCGKLYYDVNTRNEMEKLLRNTHSREIIKNYIRTKREKTNEAINISPNIIKHILQYKGTIN